MIRKFVLVYISLSELICYGETKVVLEAFKLRFACRGKERRHQNLNLINVHNKTQLPKHSSR